MTPKDTIERALQPGPDKSILAHYIRLTFDGKVGVAQAQDLAQMYLAYEKYTDNPKVIATNYNGKILPYEKEYFDRIIISHCLEHIMDPESFLHEMMKKLKRFSLRQEFKMMIIFKFWFQRICLEKWSVGLMQL